MKEAERTQLAIQQLSDVRWAKPLISRLKKVGGIKSENMPIMFEIRFAHELHLAGVTAEYEYAAGVGDSTVDFRTNTSPPWLIELVSIRTSDAAKRAIRQTGPIYEQLLSPTPDDPAMCEEAEMITAEQKIGEKVFSDGKPTKFPTILDSLHLILTDIRGYLDEGGDGFDYCQMAYGVQCIPPWMIHYWEGTPGQRCPISGLFEKEIQLSSGQYIQERIHFLGFVRERSFKVGEILNIAYYLPNPHLFQNDDEVRKTFQSYPLLGEKDPT